MYQDFSPLSYSIAGPWWRCRSPYAFFHILNGTTITMSSHMTFLYALGFLDMMLVIQFSGGSSQHAMIFFRTSKGTSQSPLAPEHGMGTKPSRTSSSLQANRPGA